MIKKVPGRAPAFVPATPPWHTSSSWGGVAARPPPPPLVDAYPRQQMLPTLLKRDNSKRITKWKRVNNWHSIIANPDPGRGRVNEIIRKLNFVLFSLFYYYFFCSRSLTFFIS